MLMYNTFGGRLFDDVDKDPTVVGNKNKMNRNGKVNFKYLTTNVGLHIFLVMVDITLLSTSARNEETESMPQKRYCYVPPVLLALE